MRRLDQLAEPKLPVKFPATPGYRPGVRGEPLPGLVLENEYQGQRQGRARGQDRRGQGQYLRRRRADDERVARARGLRAGDRRHGRDARARRRRHHHRQGGLRGPLLLSRQSYLRHRARSAIRTTPSTAPAGHRAAAPRWSPRRTSTWRSAAIRAARSARRPAGAASTVSSPPGVSFR